MELLVCVNFKVKQSADDRYTMYSKTKVFDGEGINQRRDLVVLMLLYLSRSSCVCCCTI